MKVPSAPGGGKRIAEIAKKIVQLLSRLDAYEASVKKLCCFLGVKTQTAFVTIVEVGDFKRFPSAERFASYIDLVPGEDTSGGDQNRLGVTKAGNRHSRMLLVEAAQSFYRGQVGYKSATLKQHQSGNAPEILQNGSWAE